MENQIKKKSLINRNPVITGICIVTFFIILISSSTDNAQKSSLDEALSIQQNEIVEVISINTKVIEKNSVWWKYSYIFTIKNTTPKDKIINAKVIWYDKEGFAINEKSEYSLEIPANSEKTFSDFDLINIDIAPNIESVKVEI